MRFKKGDMVVITGEKGKDKNMTKYIKRLKLIGTIAKVTEVFGRLKYSPPAYMLNDNQWKINFEEAHVRKPTKKETQKYIESQI